jgi:hypothetical protein
LNAEILRLLKKSQTAQRQFAFVKKSDRSLQPKEILITNAKDFFNSIDPLLPYQFSNAETESDR